LRSKNKKKRKQKRKRKNKQTARWAQTSSVARPSLASHRADRRAHPVYLIHVLTGRAGRLNPWAHVTAHRQVAPLVILLLAQRTPILRPATPESRGWGLSRAILVTTEPARVPDFLLPPKDISMAGHPITQSSSWSLSRKPVKTGCEKEGH
jgi:hypothetical protein